MKRFAFFFSLCLVGVACRNGSESEDNRPALLPTVHAPDPGLTGTGQGSDPVDACAADAGDDGAFEAPADDDSGPDVGAPAFTLHATPSAIAVPQGGQIDVDVAVSRADGFGEPIDVTVDGLPSGVTASALHLGPAETNGAITLTAPANVGVPRPDVARVRGHVSTGSRSASIQLTVRGPASSIDRSFGQSGVVHSTDAVTDVKEQSDGKFVFTGETNGDPGIPVCRLEADGTPDLSFGSSSGCIIFDPLSGAAHGLRVAIHDEVIYLDFISSSGTGIARFTRQGVLDATFGTGGWITLSSVGAVDMFIVNERIILAGAAAAGASDGKAFLARLNLDGTLDADFATSVFGSNRALHVVRLPDCRFVVSTGFELYAFRADGRPDASFGSGGTVTLPFIEGGDALAAVGNGDILAGGPGMAVARFSRSGVLVESYAPLSGALWVHDLALATDGTILHGGNVSYSDSAQMGIGRRRPDGHADAEFGTNGVNGINVDFVGPSGSGDIEVTDDGRYVLGGGTGHVGGGLIVRVWN